MFSDNSQYSDANKHSINSAVLSITCTLILIFLLLSSSDSSSLLLRLTLVAWLIQATLNQVRKPLNSYLTNSSRLRDARFSLGMFLLDVKPSSFINKLDNTGVDKRVTHHVPESKIPELWNTTFVSNLSLRLGKAQISSSVMLMKLNGVTDSTLRGNHKPAQFYKEIWNEDILMRADPREQLSFGFRCLSESCIFVIMDGFVSRLIQTGIKKIQSVYWWSNYK